jgi:AcrR family transcriptional regulator
MPPKKGTPNRKGAIRREQILDAATELFARHGYRGTGILELAERVGISHVGILHHFGSKEELLRAVIERNDRVQADLTGPVVQQGVLGAFARSGSASAIRSQAVLIRLRTVLLAENLDPDDPLHDYFDQRQQEVRGIIRAEIRAGQADGRIRTDIDPDTKAAEVLAFIVGIEIQWLLNPDAINLEQVYASFGRSLTEGLTAVNQREGAG